jgi:16S rRNA A1518/A1519 N6-dimethyltransferase RsmA/KsgA/DIM1 with predicted DNA glycosylase/AP lyase activity
MVDVILILVIAILLIFLVWISSALFGAPFQPSSDKELSEIMELAKVKKGEKTADLGSGNGKIVIEFAKHGAEAHGFEINPLLVLLSQRRIKKLGLQNANIHWKNFMKQDFSDFNTITSFQISYIMPDLERKLMRELRKGSKVVSNTWKFPTWKPEKKLGKVYLYKKD